MNEHAWTDMNKNGGYCISNVFVYCTILNWYIKYPKKQTSPLISPFLLMSVYGCMRAGIRARMLLLLLLLRACMDEPACMDRCAWTGMLPMHAAAAAAAAVAVCITACVRAWLPA
jgi:hypothetical protein